MRRSNALFRSWPWLTATALALIVPPSDRAEAADDPAKAATQTAEKAIRDSDDAFVKAFNAGDSKAIAQLFTEDAEAVDESGATIQGRDAIRSVYEALFKERKGWKIAIELDSLRLITPDTAIETGRSTLNPADNATPPERSLFSAVLVKRDDKWLQTYVRELPEIVDLPGEHLKALEWLVGEWVDESRNAVVFSSCQWSKDRHFLIRDFTTQVAGKTEMTVQQRIGWDPATRQIKSWVFDSEGGHSEGLWSRSGNQWFVKSSGVLPDGKLATATHVYTIESKQRIHFQSIARTIGSEAIEDGVDIPMVRKPPTPPNALSR